MRRELVSILFLALLLGLFAGYAWLTRHPDAPALERAVEWPVVGPLARRFREAYLPTSGTAEGPASTAESPRNDGSPDGSEPGDSMEPGPSAANPVIHDARPWVWVKAGTEIHTAPSRDSPLILTTTALANLPYYEHRGDWYRIRQGEIWGWAEVSGKPLAWRRDGNRVVITPGPALVLPLPSRPPDPVRLAAGLDLLGSDATEMQMGPYRLYTDLSRSRFIDRIREVVIQLEDLYRERYGLEPIEGAHEAILLFSQQADYRVFSSPVDRLKGVEALAHVAGGVVALYSEGRSRGGVISSLIHELTHLLNRRALGPALPPWLGEGIADDLSMSRVEPGGKIQPGTLGGEQTRSGRRVLRRGGRASAVLLQQEADEGRLLSLGELTQLDWPAFVAGDRGPLHYSQSSFFIRFLLSDWLAGTRAGFQGFLADIARGVPISEEALLGRLGRSWAELDQSFHVWLRLQFLLPVGEVPEPAEPNGSSSRQRLPPST